MERYCFISLFDQDTSNGYILKIAIDKTRAAQIPEEGALNDYLCLSTDEYEKLRPKAEENSLRHIVFDSHVSYRTIDEGYLDFMKLTLNSLSKTNFKKTLYEVSSSDYLAWFHEQSYGMFEDSNFNLRHFFISTDTICVDVIAYDLPKILCADGTELTY